MEPSWLTNPPGNISINSTDYSDDIDYTFKSSLSAFHNYLWTNGCKATPSLGAKVTLVDYSSTTIKVTTGKNTYYTNKLMLNPSLWILKAGLMSTPPLGVNVIKFNPALPADKVKSINAIGFGKFEKLFVTVNQPFFDSNSSTQRFTCKINASCMFTEAGSQNSQNFPLLDRRQCSFLHRQQQRELTHAKRY